MAHLNRLSKETSPYLLQHASNPVDWYPWGEEALQRARDEQKPLLVSIGYSACHWCHVMEHESFENAHVAAFMNDRLINIKIDREERPDLDHIFMDAVQALTGSGGWPLNVFLTPEGKPFYGGTYFPPEKAFNRASWMDVLHFIDEIWNTKREEVLKQADTLTNHIEESSGQFLKLKSESSWKMEEMFSSLMGQADVRWGGFGSAPKFPQTMSLRFLLMYHKFFKEQSALEHVERSVILMCRGGLFDQLAGGFARYSTDEKWLVPHFEKMLYDNALMLILMCELYQVTRDGFYREHIMLTFEFLENEMKDANGGYYAALDADSEGEEGKFYVWEYGNFTSLLGEEGEIAAEWFGVTQKGNWEHTNILHQPVEKKEFAARHRFTLDELDSRLGKWRAQLLSRRAHRPRPGTDDKIILGWNALLMQAFCKAAGALGEEKYIHRAVDLYQFLKQHLNVNGSWRHTFKGEARIPAFLDDLSLLAQGLIMLQEITSNQACLIEAADITTHIISAFSDEENLLFYYTGREQEDLLVRKREVFDAALPSGNSTMAWVLNYLGIVLDRKQWKERSEAMTIAMRGVVNKYPGSFGNWAAVGLELEVGTEEMVITGTETEQEKMKLLEQYFPNKVFQSHTEPADFPLLKGKNFEDPHWVYRCKNYSCSSPVKTVSELDL